MKKACMFFIISLIISCQSQEQKNESVKAKINHTKVYVNSDNSTIDYFTDASELENNTNKNDGRQASIKLSFLDSIRNVILVRNGGVIKDSIAYKFTLDKALETEGNDGIAIYKNGNLHSIALIAYSESGQSQITYEFKNNKIKVCEERSYYIQSHKDIADIHNKPKTDMYCSYINYNGVAIGDSTSQNTTGREIFPIINKNIPHTLNTNKAYEKSWYAQK